MTASDIIFRIKELLRSWNVRFVLTGNTGFVMPKLMTTDLQWPRLVSVQVRFAKLPFLFPVCLFCSLHQLSFLFRLLFMMWIGLARLCGKMVERRLSGFGLESFCGNAAVEWLNVWNDTSIASKRQQGRKHNSTHEFWGEITRNFLARLCNTAFIVCLM